MTKITSWLKKVFGSNPHASHVENPADDGKATPSFKVLKFQHTPNPEAAQFVMDSMVIAPGKTRSFTSPEAAKGDPLAEALFKIFGVQDVFVKENFVTITKAPVVGWTALMEPIQETLESQLYYYELGDEDQRPKETGGKDILSEVDVEDFPTFSDEQKGKIIDAVLDHAIRPALANDGGGITLVGVDGNTVNIHYQGACGSCPSSTTGTLQYIESFLQDTLHKELKVQTTDPVT